MKKLFIFAVVAGIGYYAWKKFTEQDSERDLWSEVTDRV